MQSMGEITKHHGPQQSAAHPGSDTGVRKGRGQVSMPPVYYITISRKRSEGLNIPILRHGRLIAPGCGVERWGSEIPAMLTEIKLVATASLAEGRHAVRSMLGDDLSQDADIDHPLWSLKLDNGLHIQPIKDIGHSGRDRL